MKCIFKIDGMSCQHCVNNVKNTLLKLNGVEHVEVEIGKAIVQGDYSKNNVEDAIEELGFDVLSAE